ncbi:MAG: LEPR-XLL domain-containing protein, partial [Actinomycetota bacterium]
MTLAALFYAKHPRRLLPSRRRKPRPVRRRRVLLEPLEPRLLLSVTPTFAGTLSLLEGTDVNVSELTQSQTETAIAINPAIPSNLVAMANGGALPNEFTAFSTNSGQDWTTINIGPAEDGLAGGDRFDGAVAVDAFGNVHVVYMQRPTGATNSTPKAIVHAMSADGGRTYPTVNVLANAVGTDKPWIATGIDSSTPGNQMVVVTHRDGSGNIQAYAASVSGRGAMGAFSAPVQVNDVAGGNKRKTKYLP